MNIMELLDKLEFCEKEGKDPSQYGIKIITLPPLFRGDRINKTKFPVEDWRHSGETYSNLMVSEGILCKFSGKFANLQILKEPLEKLVCCHVGYEKPCAGQTPSEAVRISKHSPLISFSEKREDADEFEDRSKKAKFESCSYEDATHFIYSLEGLRGYEYKPGMYLCVFTPSKNRSEELNDKRCSRAADKYLRFGKTDVLCEAIGEKLAVQNITEKPLVLTAINVQKYISKAGTRCIDTYLLDNTRERSKRWNEWLIYPGLPGATDGHYQRIPPGDYLQFAHYAKDARFSK